MRQLLYCRRRSMPRYLVIYFAYNIRLSYLLCIYTLKHNIILQIAHPEHFVLPYWGMKSSRLIFSDLPNVNKKTQKSVEDFGYKLLHIAITSSSFCFSKYGLKIMFITPKLSLNNFHMQRNFRKDGVFSVSTPHRTGTIALCGQVERKMDRLIGRIIIIFQNDHPSYPPITSRNKVLLWYSVMES